MRTLEQLLNNYPQKGRANELVYVRHPVFKKGSWYAANVLMPTGYFIPPTAVAFNNEQACQKGCDLHNKFHWWSKAEANMIITESVSNAEQESDKVIKEVVS